jgi:hypothetical protein
VRFLEYPGRIRPLAVRPPLRILVLIANPTDFPQLDTAAEWEKLREALGDLQLGGRVQVDRVARRTLADLQRQLRRGDYHVFHYIGHGAQPGSPTLPIGTLRRSTNPTKPVCNRSA